MATTTATEPRTEPEGRASARARVGPGATRGRAIGCLVGCTGWSIGLLFWALSSGYLAALWAQVLGGFAASLALGMILLVSLEMIERAFPAAKGFFLAGGLLAVMGILLHMINTWVAPAIEAAEAVPAGSTMLVYRSHPAIPWVLIAVSLLPLTAALDRIRRVNMTRSS